jgi:hypothetical protein
MLKKAEALQVKVCVLTGLREIIAGAGLASIASDRRQIVETVIKTDLSEFARKRSQQAKRFVKLIGGKIIGEV